MCILNEGKLYCNALCLSFSGTPGEVKNVFNHRSYSSNSLIITWDHLPSLDLTDIDPDLVYTVQLFEVTCDRNISVSHQVVARSNATIQNLDLMQVYKAVIAAKNNVREARNGPSVEMRGKQHGLLHIIFVHYIMLS